MATYQFKIKAVVTAVAGSAGSWTYTVSPSAAATDTGKPHQISGTLTLTDTTQLQQFVKGAPVFLKMWTQGDIDTPYSV